MFEFKPFSKKQRKLLNWWADSSPVKDYSGIICDGAIRSGKSLCMSLSFVIWAMSRFNGYNFAMCGKTVGSFRRNVLGALKQTCSSLGYEITEHRTDNKVVISRGMVSNDFYIFGGKDEGSQDLIQGITLAGLYLDEVALMPESFVNQATGRCSVTGSKMWFNCNPSYPAHFFKEKWLDKHKDKKLLHLHFTMDDNLSLSEEIKNRYRTMYSGVFYDRYILGLWAMAEGLIYPNAKEAYGEPPQEQAEQYAISIDYGTLNAFACLLWGKYGNVWYIVDEYYYSGRDKGISKTDEDYASDLEDFLKDIPEQKLLVVIDPSAASFITLLQRKHKYRVVQADNAVLDGIRETATCMQKGYIKISSKAVNTRKELGGYVWDDKASDDRPVKIADHCADALRYWVKTMYILKKGDRARNENISRFD